MRKIKNIQNALDAKLIVIKFHEDGLFYHYCPALDIYGYAETDSEAKISFEIALEEFIKYTTAKGTLIKELERLGWTIKEKEKRHPKIEVPNFLNSMSSNEEFRRIVNKVPFEKFDRRVSIPA